MRSRCKSDGVDQRNSICKQPPSLWTEPVQCMMSAEYFLDEFHKDHKRLFPVAQDQSEGEVSAKNIDSQALSLPEVEMSTSGQKLQVASELDTIHEDEELELLSLAPGTAAELGKSKDKSKRKSHVVVHKVANLLDGFKFLKLQQTLFEQKVRVEPNNSLHLKNLQFILNDLLFLLEDLEMEITHFQRVFPITELFLLNQEYVQKETSVPGFHLVMKIVKDTEHEKALVIKSMVDHGVALPQRKAFGLAGRVRKRFRTLNTLENSSMFSFSCGLYVDQQEVVGLFLSWIHQLMECPEGLDLLMQLEESIMFRRNMRVRFEASTCPSIAFLKTGDRTIKVNVPISGVDWLSRFSKKVGDQRAYGFTPPAYLLAMFLLKAFAFDHAQGLQKGLMTHFGMEHMTSRSPIQYKEVVKKLLETNSDAKVGDLSVFIEVGKEVFVPDLKVQEVDESEIQIAGTTEGIGTVQPSENLVYEYQEAMAKMRPNIKFYPERVDFANSRQIVADNRNSAVYNIVHTEEEIQAESPDVVKFLPTFVSVQKGFSTHDRHAEDSDAVLKLLNSQAELVEFSQDPEKEAFAANFIRSMGMRTSAPATFPLSTTGKTIRILKDTSLKTEAYAESDFRDKLWDAQETTRPYCGLVMERVPGHSGEALKTKQNRATRTDDTYLNGAHGVSEIDINDSPNYESYGAVLKDPEVLKALGEMYLWDLLLGNHDRFLQGIHSGNVLFNVDLGSQINEPKEGCQGVEVKVNHPVLFGLDQTTNIVSLQMLLDFMGDTRFRNEKHWKRYEKVMTRADRLQRVGGGKSSEEYMKMAMIQVNRLYMFLKDFSECFLKGNTHDFPGNKRFIGWALGDEKPIIGESTEYVDMGMMEGILHFANNFAVVEALEKIHYTTFPDQAAVFFKTCHMLMDLVKEVGYDKLLIALKELQEKKRRTGQSEGVENNENDV
ncbi:hypothetical protein [Aureibacter tunicatorum]|nr:hypothetical protein [Aureibacter tunicatorum]BDD03786.1 hypothetical protein AUTU_12690 [Aureibacter tunicatorum]